MIDFYWIRKGDFITIFRLDNSGPDAYWWEYFFPINRRFNKRRRITSKFLSYYKASGPIMLEHILSNIPNIREGRFGDFI